MIGLLLVTAGPGLTEGASLGKFGGTSPQSDMNQWEWLNMLLAQHQQAAEQGGNSLGDMGTLLPTHLYGGGHVAVQSSRSPYKNQYYEYQELYPATQNTKSNLYAKRGFADSEFAPFPWFNQEAADQLNNSQFVPARQTRAGNIRSLKRKYYGMF